MITKLKKGIFEHSKVQQAAIYHGIIKGNQLYVKFPKKARRKIK